MSIIEHLKSEAIRLRKERKYLGTFASTVVAHATALAKAETKDGVTPDVSDAHALKAIKAFMKTAEENLAYSATKEKAEVELEFLKQFLPAQASEDDVKAFIAQEVSGLEIKSMKAMGGIIKAVKEKFGTSVDSGKASAWVKEALNVG